MMCSCVDQSIKIRLECKQQIQELKAIIDQKDVEISEKNTELNKKDSIIKKLNDKCSKYHCTIVKLKKKLCKYTRDINKSDKNTADLKKQIKSLEQKIQKSDSDNEKLQDAITLLNKKMDYYESAHVPPSKQGPFVKGNKGSKNNKRGKKNKNKSDTKRGGVRGHKGGTQTYKATSTVRHTSECCPECGTENICDLEKDKSRNIVSIPVFTPHEVTCHNAGVTIVVTSLWQRMGSHKPDILIIRLYVMSCISTGTERLSR